MDWKYGTGYRNWVDGFTVESNIGDNNVTMKFTNDNEVDVEELEYIVLFYTNGELTRITFPQDVSDVTSGNTVIKQEDGSYNYGQNGFDDYEIYINQAHTFGLPV